VIQSRRALNCHKKKKNKANEADVSFSYLGTEVGKGKEEVEIPKMIMSANMAYLPCYPS